MSSLALQRTSTKNLTDEQLQALIDENKSIYNQYYDAEYLESVSKHIFERLVAIYFRPKFVGFEEYVERNDPDKPIIFAGNHSGMAFPWDAMVFGSGLYQICKGQNERFLRALVAPMLSETQLMNPFLTRDMWKRVGGVDATSLNFETLMQFKETDVLIYPEGVPGIAKGFNRRYQLQRFSTSMIRMSLKHGTDIVPVYSINGEFINPYSYRVDWISRLIRLIGVPFLPIGFLTFMMPFFPWIFYFAMPAKLHFVVGKRIKPYKLTDLSFDEMTRSDFQAVRDQVQQQMQTEINEKVNLFGQKPYRWGELFKKMRQNPAYFWYYFPPTWCLVFSEHERQYQRFKKTGKPINLGKGFGIVFKWLWHNPFCIFYFIPIIGLIAIAIKGYSVVKKPE